MPKRMRAPQKIQERARQLRQQMTPAEKKLWNCLRNRQLKGFYFCKQHAVGNFIVDFFCAQAKPVIEVDGGSHPDQKEYDAERTRWLQYQKNYRVLRFTNQDVLSNIPGVIGSISVALGEHHASTK